MTVRQETPLTEALERSGATYRQLDYWSRTGRIKAPAYGSGSQRAWDYEEVEIARLIVKLLTAGLSLDVAARAARQVVETEDPQVMLTPGVWLEVTR